MTRCKQNNSMFLAVVFFTAIGSTTANNSNQYINTHANQFSQSINSDATKNTVPLSLSPLAQSNVSSKLQSTNLLQDFPAMKKNRGPISLRGITCFPRGGAITTAIDNASTLATKKQKTLNKMHQNSFLIVASTSMVAFSPLPSITRHLVGYASPQAQAIKILSILSAISASIELLLSPLVGVWIDIFGRKQPSVLLYSLITLANLGVVLFPSVGTICVSRMVNVIVSGFLMIVANAVIGDIFSSNGDNDDSDNVHSKDKMGSTLGIQAATISLGFLFGSLAGGRLIEHGERAAYGCALIFSALATLNVGLRMMDSLELAPSTTHSHTWNWSLLRRKVLEAPLSSIQLLVHYGPRMRTLALLLLLQSAPMFMGDVFQVFAKENWGWKPKDFGNIIALFGVLGIFSNLSLPFVLKLISIRTFSLLAIISSLFFPLTTILSSSYRPVLIAGCLGLYASAQKVGTTSAITSLAYQLKIPQGQLAGEKASMTALLKIACPVIYSWLYLMGKNMEGKNSQNALGAFVGKKLPFVLNLILGMMAFVVTWQNL